MCILPQHPHPLLSPQPPLNYGLCMQPPRPTPAPPSGGGGGPPNGEDEVVDVEGVEPVDDYDWPAGRAGRGALRPLAAIQGQ